MYEKSQDGYITQGFPKVEQIYELCSVGSISMNLKRRVECWNEHILRILGIHYVFSIRAELIITHNHISLLYLSPKIILFTLNQAYHYFLFFVCE